MMMWHGGAPGLQVGDLLLPPTSTGFTPTNSELTGPPARGERLAYRSDRVYATEDREFAEMFALLYSQDPDRPGDGLVYEVELDSATVDPDFATDGRSYEAAQGRIVGAGVPIASTPARLAEVLEGYKERGGVANSERAARSEARKKGKQARASRKANRKKKK